MGCRISQIDSMGDCEAITGRWTPASHQQIRHCLIFVGILIFVDIDIQDVSWPPSSVCSCAMRTLFPFPPIPLCPFPLIPFPSFPFLPPINRFSSCLPAWQAPRLVARMLL